jgi:hypothetical protein
MGIWKDERYGKKEIGHKRNPQILERRICTGIWARVEWISYESSACFIFSVFGSVSYKWHIDIAWLYPYFFFSSRLENFKGIFSTSAWVIVIFIVLVIVGIYRVPTEIHYEQEDKINVLENKYILNEYEDIDVDFFDYPFPDDLLRLMGRWDGKNFIKLGLRATNKGTTKIHCAFRLVSIKYNGEGIIGGWQEKDNWIDDEEPFENKYIKWDEGYSVEGGKIDIHPNGGIGNMLFAENNPRGYEYWLWYVNGKSKNHRTLNGRFKAIIQLEGDCEKDGIKADLDSLKFEVEFSYMHRSLKAVSVTKLPRRG